MENISVYLFEDEERQYLNNITKDMKFDQLTKDEVLSHIAFAREIMNAEDTDVRNLIDGVYSKVNKLSDEKWNELKKMIPFPVSVTAESNVDEIPTDEELEEIM